MKFSNSIKAQVLRPLSALILLFLIWVIPSNSYPIFGLDIIQQRVLLIFITALFMWITELIPAWVTSVAVSAILLFTVSDNSLAIFDVDPVDGHILSSKDIIASYADPIIFLFIGGFILASVASKFNIDRTIVNLVIHLIGIKSKRFLLGIMMVTAFCSMFISNTATAIMMLTLVGPMLKLMDENDRGRTAMILGVSVAANIGGLGTPIGTPPNAIVLKYLNDPLGLNLDIGFLDWIVIFFPVVLVLILISWLLLIKLFPFKDPTLKSVAMVTSDQEEEHPKAMKYMVYAILLLTVAMWCLDRVFGVSANVVAFVPICLFSLLGVISARDLEQIDWSVLWLVAGGFSLGLAFQDTGLAHQLISSINFDAISPLYIIISCWLISWGLSNVISNTAAATLITPIFVALAVSIAPELHAFGGPKMLLLGVAMFTSLAMILPISTPPNALAYSTGSVSKKDMQTVGLIIGGIGFMLTLGLMYFLK